MNYILRALEHGKTGNLRFKEVNDSSEIIITFDVVFIIEQ